MSLFSGTILEEMLRTRQVCVHPWLAKFGRARTACVSFHAPDKYPEMRRRCVMGGIPLVQDTPSRNQTRSVTQKENDVNEKYKSTGCYFKPSEEKPIVLSCGHGLCTNHADEENNKHPNMCPICIYPNRKIGEYETIIPEEIKIQNSSKMNKLMELIESILKKNREQVKKDEEEVISLIRKLVTFHKDEQQYEKPEDQRVFHKYKGNRIHIFSEWAGSLDLIEYAIRKKFGEKFLQTKVLRYDGSYKPANREHNLQKWRNEDPKFIDQYKILLSTITSGSLGLNLPFANHVIFFEPNFRKDLEEQAEGRIYRMGQTKQVYVYRLIAFNSMESYVKKIQDIKSRDITHFKTGSPNKYNDLSPR